jgi:hypothetical protein
VEGKWIEAGNYVLSLLGQPQNVTTQKQALSILRNLFQYLLDKDMYLEAATLQWGNDVFQTEPESTVRVFNSLGKGSLILLMGASSMSKTYAAGGYYLLDYLRDPLYTTVKLAAINEDHLRKNLFAHLVTLYRACAIPSSHEIIVQDSALWMGIKTAGMEFGISGIAFKQSQETSGQFKGYKIKPVRKTPHHQFGVMSRLRVLGDEGQNWPGGPFKDFNSLIASKTGSELIKIAVAFNPENVSQHVVQLAEPEHGFLPEDLDKLYDWESKAGWRVCRLDAARCENVVQRKVVFPGLQTYEGYLSYLKAGGDNSPNYWTFARGFPPLSGSINNIIPPQWPQQVRGEATFVDTPVSLASVDLAFMGADSAKMAVARWGLASSWRDERGKRHTFEDRLSVGKARPRHVLQIDQIIPLEKHDDTTRMAEEIIGRAKMLGIKPGWVILDKTGIGLGTYSHLKRVWGDVQGVSWNEKATESKILSEDTDTADKQCDGVMSEMWWALRQWMNPVTGAILINPIVPTQPIHTQLTSRRFVTGRRGIKVEPKDEYKARNGNVSPDEADAIVMLPHLVRMVGEVLPGTVEERTPQGEHDAGAQSVQFTPIKEFTSVDTEDSIMPDGVDKELA